jgi:hypothetical protein
VTVTPLMFTVPVRGVDPGFAAIVYASWPLPVRVAVDMLIHDGTPEGAHEQPAAVPTVSALVRPNAGTDNEVGVTV